MPNILKSPTVGRLVDDSSRPARRPVFDVYAHEIGAKNRHQKTGTSKMSLRRLTCNLLPNFSGIIFGNEYGHALFSCLFMEPVFFGTGFRRWFLVRVSCESRPDWPVVRAFSREALSCLTLISHQQAACIKKFQSRNAATAVSTCKRTKRIRKKSLVNYKLYQKAAIIPVQPVQVHALQTFYLWVTSFGTPLKRKPELNAVDVIPHQRLHGRPQQQYCHIKPPPLYATKLRTFLNE